LLSSYPILTLNALFFSIGRRLLEPCRAKLGLCATFQQNTYANFTLVDHLGRSFVDLTYQILFGDGSFKNGSAELIRSSNAYQQTMYSIKFKVEQLGAQILAIYQDGRQLSNSPFRFLVIKRDCTVFFNRIADINGECVCIPQTFVELNGVCTELSTIYSSVSVPIVFLIVFAVFLLHKYHVRKENAMWRLLSRDITFPEVEEELGRGSFGVVVKAELRKSPVAVKQFYASLAFTGTNVLSESQKKARTVDINNIMSQSFIRHNELERLQHHIKRLVRIRHPCIVTVMGAVIKSSKRSKEKYSPLHLVMEWMEMGSLFEILHHMSFPIEADTALGFVQNITRGMSFLHSYSPPLIHGDLTSSNVLVDRNFNAKLTDLAFPQKGEISGKFLWMAPELFDSSLNHENTTASDIYSFGIVLNECLTRQSPYNGLELAQVLKKYVHRLKAKLI
jgi:guanylate cyclase